MIRKNLFSIVVAVLAVVFPALDCAGAAPVTVTWTNEVEATSPTTGVIKWHADITEGWHLYGLTMPQVDDMPTFPTKFVIDPQPGLVLVGGVEPSESAQNHFDPIMNLNLPWWDKPVTFSQKFRVEDGVEGVNIVGHVEYMMCNDKACTPPTKTDFAMTFGNAAPAAAPADDNATAQGGANVPAAKETVGDKASWWAPVEIESATDEPAENASIWAILLMGFVGGLLALLTPCVWPMIPMTVSFFLKKGKSRGKAIADAITYGLSIVVIFLVLGLAITAIFGAGTLNDIATSAVFNVLFFILLVVFAISFFGAFDIKLPSRWANAMDARAEQTTGFISIFFMAFTLVLVSFSCTGPIIGTLLVEAASEGSMTGPAVGMGGFALGLALPFALFAFFPSMLKEMPKSGGWMNSVKVVLGFIELILSLKFLSVADLAYGWRILDRETFIAIWIVLFVLLGLYLLGKLRFSHDSESKHTSVGGFFLAVISLSFAVYMLPGLWGAPLKSISAFAPPLYTQDFNLYGGEFREFDDYNEGMAYAAENHRPVLIDFSGYACVNCRKMEGAVFDTEQVRNIVENDFVLIKLMVDDKTPLKEPYTVTDEDGKTQRITTVGEKWIYLEISKFGNATQPYYVMLDNEGQPLGPSRSYDENKDAFIAWLTAGVEAYNK